ncbi:hypothetical protein HYH03_002575 [Edaphochlamys debaryana]|uniref:Uncharacterized protein n=1 Tax=Edaphochlamys debaryana TaxID=47281 RepID=A0A835YBL5_9CHLO|nr:hypothetical protein HYH03_002575 [Edaphochlamys debaryana]|eukprot:KAG2499636.1 hypothetical protein HYH03_002575 [Edaphochlamys debaryana]
MNFDADLDRFDDPGLPDPTAAEDTPANPAPIQPAEEYIRPAKAGFCRDRYKTSGWNTPPQNLLEVYLEACDRHGVPANSGVVSQLQRRVRATQSGPWQRVVPRDDLASPMASSAALLHQHHSTRSVTAMSLVPPPRANTSSLTVASGGAATVLTIAQTAQELRDMVVAHVYPLSMGSSVAAPGSENHAATVSAAVVALAAGGPGGMALYSARAVAHVCKLLDPRTPWEQQLGRSGLPDDTRVLDEAAFHALVDAATTAASLGELRQAALEVLSRPVGHGTLDLEGLAGALFDWLDCGAQGSIPASEARAAVAAFSPHAAADMYGLIEQHPPLARPAADEVTRAEFVEVLVALAPGLVPPGASEAAVRDKAEIAVNAMLESKIRQPHVYDFSRCYLGPRGLLPVLDALGRDSAFVALSLANCGLGCSSVERLCAWLQGHPSVTALDLSGNLISDRGGMAVARLLQENPPIVDLGIGSSLLLPPPASRTHHDALGPSPCEDAAPLLQALTANRAARRASAAEIVRALRQHGPELRAMFFDLLARDGKAGSSVSGGYGGASAAGGGTGGGAPAADGRVPLGALREALGEVTAEWGFEADALDQVLQAERLLGTATAGRTADASGRLGVTYDELMHFLRSEDQVVRVARAFRSHLPEAKQLFFALAPEPATAGGTSAAGVAGPRAALSTVRAAIVATAAAPGSGWDVSEQDLEAVLSPGVLRAHCRDAATGNAAPRGGAGAGAGYGFGGPGGLLLPEWQGGGPAAGGSPKGAQGPNDMLISWPELCNTLLFLFNR